MKRSITAYLSILISLVLSVFLFTSVSTNKALAAKPEAQESSALIPTTKVLPPKQIEESTAAIVTQRAKKTSLLLDVIKLLRPLITFMADTSVYTALLLGSFVITTTFRTKLVPADKRLVATIIGVSIIMIAPFLPQIGHWIAAPLYYEDHCC